MIIVDRHCAPESVALGAIDADATDEIGLFVGFDTFDDDVRTILWSATRRLERLAADIVDVSRAEEHLTRLRPSLTTTRALVTSAVDAVRERYENKGVQLHTHVDDAPVAVDTDRIGQVLGNLLDNALRHTPAGGTVTVTSTEVGHRHVEITVSDSGEGIAPHHLDHLFDRFYRADTSRGRHSGGSGIGLTITRALVEAHGGHIRAHSDGPGQGASFTVEIPKPD